MLSLMMMNETNNNVDYDNVDDNDNKEHDDEDMNDEDEANLANEEEEEDQQQQQQQYKKLHSNTTTSINDFPYQCCIEITLPSSSFGTTNDNTNNIAKQLQQILSVDPELTNQTRKVITTLVKTTTKSSNNNCHHHHNNCILSIHVYAKQCKGLRVSISSILEYTQLAIKCYQEFA